MNTNSSGVGFLGLLTIVFIALKLTGSLTWPWVWVLAPLWFPFAALFIFIVVGFGFIFIQDSIRETRKRNLYDKRNKK